MVNCTASLNILIDFILVVPNLVWCSSSCKFLHSYLMKLMEASLKPVYHYILFTTNVLLLVAFQTQMFATVVACILSDCFNLFFNCIHLKKIKLWTWSLFYRG